MTRIRGYSFTRKDKVFAEFETNVGKFTFKESHSSKKGYYKVGIYAPSGEKIYNVQMNREQINKIKEGSGITNINFMSEEKFKNYIENTYINRDFDEENFSDFFTYHFSRSYQFIANTDYVRYSEGETLTGHVDQYYNRYIAYLMSIAPKNILENIYRNDRKNFQKTFKYREYGINLEKSEKAVNVGKVMEFLESIEAQVKQALGASGVDYMSYDEFVSSGTFKDFAPKSLERAREEIKRKRERIG